MSSSSPRLFLVSSSPRRRELLSQIGVSFEVVTPDIPELPLPGESPQAFVIRLAEEKARAGLAMLNPPASDASILLLGSDTSVVVDGRILGKPVDRDDGLAMLASLSGRSHEVLTAVTLLDKHGRQETLLNRSEVVFRAISEAERAAYWASGEPEDKAGGYAVQGRGAIFISRLNGSYSGVMGLPLYETAQLLESFGLSVLQ